MATKTYRVVLWTLALTGLCLDQATKYGVFSWLARADEHQVWLFQATPETGFSLHAQYKEVGADGSYTPHVNEGALFGFLQNYQSQANTGFAVVSLLAAVAIGYWSCRRGAARDPWVCAALGLILAGTLGNLYDRVVFQGVRDFLHWNYLFNWPVFNLADACLVCGAGLLMFQAFVRSPSRPPVDLQTIARPEADPREATAAAPAGVTHTTKT